MVRHPPRSKRTYTPVPYTTRFRTQAGHRHQAAVAHEGHPALLNEAGALGREKTAEQESLHIGAPERRGDLRTGKAVAEAVLCAVIDEEYQAERPGNLRGIDIPARRHRAAAALRAPIAKQPKQVRISQQLRDDGFCRSPRSALRISHCGCPPPIP